MESVDTTHATPEAADFFHSFFSAKNRHDVDATMNHFSKTLRHFLRFSTKKPRSWIW
jgi:hypothetical protein